MGGVAQRQLERHFVAISKRLRGLSLSLSLIVAHIAFPSLAGSSEKPTGEVQEPQGLAAVVTIS